MTEKMTLQCPNCGANVSADCTCCNYCRSVLTAASCPSCFGAVFKGMKFCPWCGDAVEREVINSGKSFSCPRCEHKLSTVKIGSATVNECTNCGGLWLDNDTLRKICDDAEKSESTLIFPLPVSVELKPVSLSERMYIPCPECKQLMYRKNFADCSGIIVDWCKQHGTWFDRQELQQTVDFIKSGGLDKARKAELERMKEEQQSIDNMKFNQTLDKMYFEGNKLFREETNDSLLLDIIASIGKKFF